MTATGPSEATAAPSIVTLITQTRVSAGHDDEFKRWQDQVDDVVDKFPGFIGREIYRPNPPVQVDWVVSQRFRDAGSARAWLQSDERLKLLKFIQPALVGQDDIHLVPAGVAPNVAAPVTAAHCNEGQTWTGSGVHRVAAPDRGGRGPIRGLQWLPSRAAGDGDPG